MKACSRKLKKKIKLLKITYEIIMITECWIEEYIEDLYRKQSILHL